MNGEYILPLSIAQDDELALKYNRALDYADTVYRELTESLITNKIEERYPNRLPIKEWIKTHQKEYKAIEKEAIEDARYILPSACTTKMEFTMNVRELLHFFKQRCCKRAQWEIRALANEMLKQCKEVSPLLFKNAGAPCSTCTEGELKCK